MSTGLAPKRPADELGVAVRATPKQKTEGKFVSPFEVSASTAPSTLSTTTGLKSATSSPLRAQLSECLEDATGLSALPADIVCDYALTPLEELRSALGFVSRGAAFLAQGTAPAPIVTLPDGHTVRLPVSTDAVRRWV